jgi:hypothetical protein
MTADASMAAQPDLASYDLLRWSEYLDQVNNEKKRANQHQQAEEPWFPKAKVVWRQLAFRCVFAQSIGPAYGRPKVMPRRDGNTFHDGGPGQEPH